MKMGFHPSWLCVCRARLNQAPRPVRLLLLFGAGGFIAFRAGTAGAAFITGFRMVWRAVG